MRPHCLKPEQPPSPNLIDSKRVEELPLNSRDLTQLTYLQPGIIKIPRTGGGVFSGMGDMISVAGSRGNQNLYLLDGVASSDLSGNPQSAMGSYVGAETIQEFQIVTNNYSAEYRSQPGGIISAVTKSGTNSLRGSAFWTHRNDSLDSANYFDTHFSEARFQPSPGWRVDRRTDRYATRRSFSRVTKAWTSASGSDDTITVPSMLMRQGILPGGRVVPVNARCPALSVALACPGAGELDRSRKTLTEPCRLAASRTIRPTATISSARSITISGDSAGWQ